MKNFILHFLLFSTLLSLLTLSFYILGKDIWYPYYKKCFIEKDIQAMPCQEKSPLPSTPPIATSQEPCPECPSWKETPRLSSEQRLKHSLADSNFIIYPKRLTLIGLKNEKLLEVWGELNGKQIHIRTYPFTAFSGQLGPKFREGDRQIPEGIYGISYLNPNSKFHLSMRVNYPNKFDKAMAKRENRINLGGDIMIHGSDKTIGCIPIGDEKIEELYFLVEQVGIENTKVILSPIDFRLTNVQIKTQNHLWIKRLYKEIKTSMLPYQE